MYHQCDSPWNKFRNVCSLKKWFTIQPQPEHFLIYPRPKKGHHPSLAMPAIPLVLAWPTQQVSKRNNSNQCGKPNSKPCPILQEIGGINHPQIVGLIIGFIPHDIQLESDATWKALPRNLGEGYRNHSARRYWGRIGDQTLARPFSCSVEHTLMDMIGNASPRLYQLYFIAFHSHHNRESHYQVANRLQ